LQGFFGLPFLDEAEYPVEHDDGENGECITHFTDGQRDDGGQHENGDQYIEELPGQNLVPAFAGGDLQDIRAVPGQALLGLITAQSPIGVAVEIGQAAGCGAVVPGAV